MNRQDLAASAWVVGIGTAILVASGAAVWDERTPSWEIDLFRAINGRGDELEVVLWGPMQLGQVSAVVVLPGLFYLFTRRWAPALATTGAAFGAWLAAKGCKHVVERKRPGFYVDDAQLREGFAADLGWPSGHVAVIAAVTTGLWPWLSPPVRMGGVAAIVAVSVARIYFGAHLPLDAVGGIALGVAAGGIAQAVARRAEAARSSDQVETVS